MEEIITNIKNPAWWFSAFIIAIIASLIAAFAKDIIERNFAKVFSKLRQKQYQRLEAQKEFIQHLDQNEGYLIISMIRAATLIFLFFSSMIIFLLSPMWVQLQVTLCQSLNTKPECSFEYGTASIALFTFGMFSMVSGYNAVVVTRLVMKGFRAYRASRGFSKIAQK